MSERTVPLAFAYYAEGENYETMMRQSIETLKEQMPGADVRIINPAAMPDYMQVLRHVGSKSLFPMMARLAIPILPQFSDCKRVCWLDADTEVVHPDIKLLADIDLGGHCAGACRDALPNRLTRPAVLTTLFKCPRRRIYLCSGTLLFDLERTDTLPWSELLPRMVRLCVNNLSELKFPDQDLMNIFVDMQELPTRFSFFASWLKWARQGQAAPVVVQYCGKSRWMWKSRTSPPEVLDNPTVKRVESGDLSVDAVVAAVDPDAPGWRESFDAHVRESSSHGSAAARFRKNAPLSLQLRLIRKNMPWIRTIWVAVADRGHFADEDLSGIPGVRLVPHESFIPQEQLPVFNSYAIEWYLHRIPGLAPVFIYFNDDFYPTAPSTMADFVDCTGRTFLTMRRSPWGTERSIWDKLCRRTYDWAKKRFGDPAWPAILCHAPRLWSVDENEEALKAALSDHGRVAARYRDCGKDIEANISFCLVSAMRHGWLPRPATDYLYLRLDSVPAVERAVESWRTRKFVCVNDAGQPPSGTNLYNSACARLKRALETLASK